MNTMTVWELVQTDRFEEACKLADIEFSKGSSLLPLRNKIYALLHLGKLDEAIETSERITHANRGDTDTDFIFLGVARWLKGMRNDAVHAWKEGLGTKYTDAAGGVELPLLLFFAGIRNLDDELRVQSLGYLKEATKSKRSTNWPGPLASYVLGLVSEQELYSRIVSQPILRAKQSCQADFYAAINRLATGDEAGCRTRIEACLAHGAAAYSKHEFYLAKAELNAP